MNERIDKAACFLMGLILATGIVLGTALDSYLVELAALLLLFVTGKAMEEFKKEKIHARWGFVLLGGLTGLLGIFVL